MLAKVKVFYLGLIKLGIYCCKIINTFYRYGFEQQTSMMKRFFVKYWWIFPIINLVCLLLIIPSLNYDLWRLASSFIIVFILLMVIQGIILILCLCEKKWWRAVGSVFGGVVCFVVFSFVSFVYLIHANSQPDLFGKEHPIPADMKCEEPLGVNYINTGDTMSFSWDNFKPVEPIVDSLSKDSYLQIWKDFQGGMYLYSFYYPALPDGKVFLRCFEATENIELSAFRLRAASSVEVKNHTGFGAIANKQKFMIYEGDWEDYYAARIEVWHKNARTGEETKLLEKIYRVEGWMR